MAFSLEPHPNFTLILLNKYNNYERLRRTTKNVHIEVYTYVTQLK